jgi:hypothetical protein
MAILDRPAFDPAMTHWLRSMATLSRLMAALAVPSG